ncbi:hypothetical protein HYV74_03345 [Candidatus Uhrbacteria bacterium]|nr:hypothetical protein [Candidatus Uhrbacteria bacterium]
MSPRFGEPSWSYTGRQFERDFVGSITQDRAYQEALQKVATPDGFVRFDAALRLVRAHQPWDPTNPDADLLRDLRLEIIDQLHLREQDADRVRAYTAVGSPLDIFHGIDAFIEYQDQKTENVRRITLDLTLKEHKDADQRKANILIRELPAPEEDTYLQAVTRYAKEAMRFLQPSARHEHPPRRP